MIKINDINDTRVLEFKSIRDTNIRSQNILIAESEKVVLKLLNSKLKINKLFVTPEFYKNNSQLKSLSEDQIFVAEQEIMETIVGHRLHQGIMASAQRPDNISLQELDRKILILNGLSSPENVGTIIRTAAGFNINSVIVDAKTVSPYLRRCIRVSMGNIFSMKIHFTEDLEVTIKELQNNDYQIFSTANEKGAIELKHVEFSSKAAIITGSEGHGIDRSILDLSNSIVRIPMDETVAHLNAACATAIFLYHFNDSY